MRTATALALTAIVLPLVGCAGGGVSPNESLDWNPGHFAVAAREKTGWRGVRGDDTWRLVYAKRGESADRWTEKAEVTQLPIAITMTGRVSWNPESVMNGEKTSVERKGCPTDGWTVLGKDRTSILWEWQDIRCPGYFHRHEIVRVVMGRWYLWMISYGIRDRSLSADERRALIENLLTARVVRE